MPISWLGRTEVFERERSGFLKQYRDDLLSGGFLNDRPCEGDRQPISDGLSHHYLSTMSASPP